MYCSLYELRQVCQKISRLSTFESKGAHQKAKHFWALGRNNNLAHHNNWENSVGRRNLKHHTQTLLQTMFALTPTWGKNSLMILLLWVNKKFCLCSSMPRSAPKRKFTKHLLAAYNLFLNANDYKLSLIIHATAQHHQWDSRTRACFSTVDKICINMSHIREPKSTQYLLLCNRFWEQEQFLPSPSNCFMPLFSVSKEGKRWVAGVHVNINQMRGIHTSISFPCFLLMYPILKTGWEIVDLILLQDILPIHFVSNS